MLTIVINNKFFSIPFVVVLSLLICAFLTPFANSQTFSGERDSLKDFDTPNAAGNKVPLGLWSDGTTMWVSDGSGGKIYAYNLATKARDSSEYFSMVDGLGGSYGLWSNGTTMWVGSTLAANPKIYAYNLATKARDSSKDFNTLSAAGNTTPVALWSNGITMWALDTSGGKIYAYNLATKARDSAKDFNTLVAENTVANTAYGLWSDGITMWVADNVDDKIYAYNLATKARDSAKDFNTLSVAGNTDPRGLWSDGTTMYVSEAGGGGANNTSSKIYAYTLFTTPPSPTIPTTPLTSTTPTNTSPSARFKITGYIWNEGLGLWWRTDCGSAIGGVSSVVPGEIGDCSNSSVAYNHNAENYNITGKAFSPIAKSIDFDTEVEGCPTRETSATTSVRIKRAKLVKIPALVTSSDNGIRIIGCVNVPFLKEYILLSPYHADGSKIAVPTTTPFTNWEGVKVQLVSSSERNSDDMEVIDSVEDSIRLSHCGFSGSALLSSQAELSLRRWSFGENTLPAGELRVSCYDETKFSVSSSVAKTSGSLINPTNNIPALELDTPAEKVRFGQLLNYNYSCGLIRQFSQIGITDNYTTVPDYVRTDLGASLLNTFSDTHQTVVSSNLRDWANIRDEIDKKNKIICKDPKGIFEDLIFRPKKIELIESFISKFTISSRVIATPRIVDIEYQLQVLNTELNLKCNIVNISSGSTNEAILSTFNSVPGINSGVVKIPLVSDAAIQLKCIDKNTVDDPEPVVKLTSVIKKVRVLPNTYKERTVSANINTTPQLTVNTTSFKITVPLGANAIDIFLFESETRIFSEESQAEEKIITFNSTQKELIGSKPFYVVAWNTDTNEEGSKVVYTLGGGDTVFANVPLCGAAINTCTVGTSSSIGTSTSTWNCSSGGQTASCHLPDGEVWTQVDSNGSGLNAPWSARNLHRVVVFADALWLLGGHDGVGSYESDIWRSTDGRTWSRITNNARWSGRQNHQVVVFNNALWLLGGHDNRDKKDIWRSTDGRTWSRITNNAPWSTRRAHQVVVFKDALWLLGGRGGGAGGLSSLGTRKNDIWKSTNGRTWTQVDANGSAVGKNAPWSARSSHQAVSFNNALWVLGGYDGSRKNDVWKSTDGSTWEQVNSNAPWSARNLHEVVAFNDALWVLGGKTSARVRKNDVWKSTDGSTWTQVDANGSDAGNNAPWSARSSHQAVSFNNALWVLGGYDDSRKNDIWRSLPTQ